MKARITNNTDYNITLINDIVIKCYETTVVNINDEVLASQIKNLEKKEGIRVVYF